MRTALGAALVVVFAASSARAADLAVGVVPSTLKVRPKDQPTTSPSVSLIAAKNEFEAFQIVVRANTVDVAKVSAKLSTPLGSIPAANVVFYAERYYDVAVPSNDEGAVGLWPDPLVPDVDTYFQEKRNAFPITVPAGETRVIWVDVLVPQSQAPGDYSGVIEVSVGGVSQAKVPVSLHVGTFSLPSTATLQSAFGMGFNSAPIAHCGNTAFPYCGGDADKSNAIRALYLRSALEHRMTISDTDFQPPFGGDQALFEKHVLPLISGTASTRLPGAKLTSVVLDGSPSQYPQWIAYAKSKGFFDRLFAYPIDEPNGNAAAWNTFITDANALHAADPKAAITLTSTIQQAKTFSADDKIDIFTPVLDEMYGRPQSMFPGDQRAAYDVWASKGAPHRMWMYQSCDQHGCGACKQPSPGVDYTGWPQRVIDSTGVQDRAFEWWSFLENTQGELYFETTYQLATAWDADGQCAFSGSGDGTIFYPGKPSIIGGTSDIPIESIRVKLVREGMEDYEYLVQAAAIDPVKARQIALALFPTAYDCNKPPAKLEAARAQLFAMLDHPLVMGDDFTPFDGGRDGGGPSGEGGAGLAPTDNGGCGCESAPRGANGVWRWLSFALVALALVRHRSSRKSASPEAGTSPPQLADKCQ